VHAGVEKLRWIGGTPSERDPELLTLKENLTATATWLAAAHGTRAAIIDAALGVYVQTLEPVVGHKYVCARQSLRSAARLFASIFKVLGEPDELKGLDRQLSEQESKLHAVEHLIAERLAMHKKCWRPASNNSRSPGGDHKSQGTFAHEHSASTGPICWTTCRAG
jgi:hypothetical protein